ncbi:MAG: RNA polymerase sigma factor RpoH [Pseudomonadota bacterium]|nr:RNA polymerase sigma factor RpoH [Pseudomonadota bacterium]MEC8461169.1 RNA polymerase sigma factor RpoH [Pseudomonadota bacterium]
MITQTMLPACCGLGSIEAYIRWTHQVPILSKDEERMLYTRFKETGDVSAARKLIMSHLRFVVYVSKSYLGYGLPQADIIQEGNIGLMKALKRFDISVGVRFVSFAVYWIKSEIQEFVLRNWRIVRVATTKSQRKLFFKLRSFMRSNHWLTSDDVAHISSSLNVPEKDVTTMQQRLYAADVALAAQDSLEQGQTSSSRQVALSSTTPSPEVHYIEELTQRQQKQWLEQSLQHLGQRSADIIRKRWLQSPKATLQSLATHHNVSVERIRQLEHKALETLKAACQTDEA